MGFFLSAVLNAATTIIIIAIILRALLSFTPLGPYHPLVRIMHQFTEPFIQPFRRLMPATGMMDFSPMIAILVLSVANRVLQQILISLFP
jgi:YggT family protein